MVYPVTGKPITTAYGVKGSMWSCGYHDGIDQAAPTGTPIVAMWGGTVVEAAYPTSFGSAFGRAVVIDHDRLDGSPGGWGLYAHMNEIVVSVGQRVEVGQKIGEVGTTGNTSGPHEHAGVYMEPRWTSGGGVNPQRWLDAGGGSGGTAPPSSEYPAPTSNEVRLSKLWQGQLDSDSVWYLQRAANDHSLPYPGNVTLPLTGNFLDQTATVIKTCQQVHGFGDDPMGSVSVGPQQAAHLFAGSGLTVVDDV